MDPTTTFSWFQASVPMSLWCPAFRWALMLAGEAERGQAPPYFYPHFLHYSPRVPRWFLVRGRTFASTLPSLAPFRAAYSCSRCPFGTPPGSPTPLPPPFRCLVMKNALPASIAAGGGAPSVERGITTEGVSKGGRQINAVPMWSTIVCLA